MDSPVPPDPYVALGVSKDADADAIKKAYRKLALKLHPDKCTDESQKAARTDEFTKIQQAYDIIGDEEKRGRYDAQVRLAELRRQNMEMRSGAAPRGSADAKYNVRMSAPRDMPREASYSARGPPPRPTYEQPRPRYYEDEYEPVRASARKTSGADEFVYVRRSAPRDEKREKTRTTPREEEKRRDAKRREAEIRESRSSKYDEYEDRRRRDYDSMRRQAEASDSYGSSTEKITEERLREAQKHMDRQTRPSMPRRESSRQVPQIYREASDPRRSAASPREKERRRVSPSKDERRRENLDPYDRRVPNLSTHTSAPPVVETAMPPQPHRSYTMPNEFEKKKKAKDVSPPPPFPRSTTQPIETMAGATSSSKRKDPKSRAMPEDSGYSSPAATPGYSTAYSYGDERAAPHVSYSSGGHRTVLREPSSSSRRNEPSPVRPSKGAVKMKGLDPSAKAPKRTTYSYSPAAGAIPIVEPKSTSSRRDRVSERDRDYGYDRSRPQYFGEHGAGTTDPRYSHPSSPYEDVNYAARPTQADIRYTSGRGREFEKPSMPRSSTYVY